MVYGYCRATTQKQMEEGYIQEQSVLIRERYFNCDIIIEESLNVTNLSSYEDLVKSLESGDTFVVTSLDRFAKSIEDACLKISSLRKKGVSVHILNIGLIDDSILGDIIYDTLVAFDDFNNALLVERIQRGKSKAKKIEGFKEGRPKKYTDDVIENALNLLDKYSYKKVEEITGISKSTLIRAKKNKI